MSTYIHIGLRRTGSTFLQKEVFNKIQNNDFCFIDPSCSKMNELIKKICFEDEIYFDVENIRKQFNTLMDKDKTNLISREVLSGDPYNGGIHKSAMLRKLKQCFPDGKIILFIRRQDTYSLSNYKTSIKHGSNLSIKEFYKPALNDKHAWALRYPNPTLDNYKYFEYVKLIYELFGKENALIIPYEKFVQHKKDVIEELCRFMKVKVPEYQDIKTNSSWGKYRIAWHRLINIFVRGRQNPYGFWKGIPVYSFNKKRMVFITYEKIINYIKINDYLSYFDQAYIDVDKYSEELLTLCAEDNKLLDEKYFLELKEYGYY